MHARHPHVRVVAEHPLDPSLMLGLDLVVELVPDAPAQLGEHSARVERRSEASDERADEAEVAQVGVDRLRRTRMLHLDRHVRPVARAPAVDLAE